MKDKKEIVSINFADEKPNESPKKKPKVVFTSKQLDEAVKSSEKGDTIIFDECDEKKDNLTLTEKENQELREKVEMMEKRFEELAGKIDNQNNVKINSEFQGKSEQLSNKLLVSQQKSPEILKEEIEEDEEENSLLDDELDLICQKVNEIPISVSKEKKEGFFKKSFKKVKFWKRKKKNIETQLPLIPLIPNDKITMQTDKDYNQPLICPLCNSKIKKGTTQKNGEIVSQVFKCKNKNCTFVKEFKFRRGA
jgi:translation initiation factor IF-2